MQLRLVCLCASNVHWKKYGCKQQKRGAYDQKGSMDKNVVEEQYLPTLLSMIP